MMNKSLCLLAREKEHTNAYTYTVHGSSHSQSLSLTLFLSHHLSLSLSYEFVREELISSLAHHPSSSFASFFLSLTLLTFAHLTVSLCASHLMCKAKRAIVENDFWLLLLAPCSNVFIYLFSLTISRHMFSQVHVCSGCCTCVITTGSYLFLSLLHTFTLTLNLYRNSKRHL